MSYNSFLVAVNMKKLLDIKAARNIPSLKC